MVIIGNKTIRFEMGGLKEINEIPAGNWLVKYDEFQLVYFLEKVDDFTQPEKLYGDVKEMAVRYLNTFNKGNKNLGIGLTGLKGTGKSLLAKEICIESKLPVIIITEDFNGSDFSAFLGNIKQEAVVFIDEFEKVYSEKEVQESFLSILDGVFMGKKIFLFTSNETSKYSNYLINRPGRIHYMKTYDRISDEILDDILNENLLNKSDITEFKEIIDMIEDANIDMVFALVKECNMYSENPRKAVKYLNIRVTNESTYEIEFIDLVNKCKYETTIKHSPLLDRYNIYVEMNEAAYNKLTSKQQDDNRKYPYSKNVMVMTSKCQISKKGREITLTHKDYKIVASPKKEYSYIF